MATGEKEHGGIGPLSTIKTEKGPLGKYEKRGNRGTGPQGTRDAGFAYTDTAGTRERSLPDTSSSEGVMLVSKTTKGSPGSRVLRVIDSIADPAIHNARDFAKGESQRLSMG